MTTKVDMKDTQATEFDAEAAFKEAKAQFPDEDQREHRTFYYEAQRRQHDRTAKAFEARIAEFEADLAHMTDKFERNSIAAGTYCLERDAALAKVQELERELHESFRRIDIYKAERDEARAEVEHAQTMNNKQIGIIDELRGDNRAHFLKINELQREVERYKAALEFYADKKNWKSTHPNGGGVDDTIIDDCKGSWTAGARAREALK